MMLVLVMENSSHITSFVFTVFQEMGPIRYFYFCVILMMYISIIFANSLLVGLICAERSLHEPMYLFVCSLCVNELYGSTALYPALLVNMLTDVHEISKDKCILQIFCIISYGTIELCNLAVMAYDRYVSIYHPLKYRLIMTPAKVSVFISIVWIYSVIKVSITVSMTARLPLCSNTVNKVYCDNYSLVKLSCISTTAVNVYGLAGLFLTVFGLSFLIVYSYGKILRVCLTSEESRKKALKTCAPHLASLMNFSLASAFELVQSRFDLSHVPAALRVFVSVYFLMISPLLTPLIYGLRNTKIRTVFKKNYSAKLFPK
ncbi:olfactory receptor 142-like [Scleropages formosus]|uniref:olfactory receptor 142-like n=1 Tax=Scleropages formosus TaxID=113540 RepID=UPI0010FA8CFA|nr:olfactory receptor 142-like [Scleropages formosus]